MDIEDKKRLLEIRNQLLDLTDELKTLIRQSGNKFAYNQASAYWLGHLDNVVQGVSDFDSCMNKTLSQLGIDPDLDPEDLEDPSEDEDAEDFYNEYRKLEK